MLGSRGAVYGSEKPKAEELYPWRTVSKPSEFASNGVFAGAAALLKFLAVQVSRIVKFAATYNLHLRYLIEADISR
jgi:hypothetical protein